MASTQKEIQKPHNIVVMTDLALGDDWAAMMGLCAFAAMNKSIGLHLVGAYGNRSTKETTKSLSQQIPLLWKQLGQESITCPQIYEGTDRAINSDAPYQVAQDGIERIIHADFPTTSMENSPIRPVEELYKSLLKSNIPIAILSLGAPTEAVYATDRLKTQIGQSIAMLGTLTTQGNTDPHREANATHDPEANSQLLELSKKHNISFTMVPLDCTENKQVLFTRKVLDEMGKQLGKDSFAQIQLLAVAGRQSAYGSFYLSRSKQGETFPYKDKRYRGVPLHDLTAAIVLIDRLREESSNPMFKYADRLVKPDEIGGIGISRPYMLPNYRVSIAGTIKNGYWKEVKTLFKQYE